MPKVGSKHFAYTEKGMKEAKEQAKKTGMPMMGKATPMKKGAKGKK